MPRNLSNGFVKLAVLLKLSDFLTSRTSVSLSAFFSSGLRNQGTIEPVRKTLAWKSFGKLSRYLKISGRKRKKMSCDESGQQARPYASKSFLFESLNVYLHIYLKY